MPVLDGFGVISCYPERRVARELPVIFLSARAGEEARVEGLEAGADDYLVKPFSANELLAASMPRSTSPSIARRLSPRSRRARGVFGR